MNTGRSALWILLNVLPLTLWSSRAVPVRAQPETVITGVVVDAEDRRPIPSAHVALVDDVLTTGNTAAELARLLKRAGAARVEVWAVARA